MDNVDNSRQNTAPGAESTIPIEDRGCYNGQPKEIHVYSLPPVPKTYAGSYRSVSIPRVLRVLYGLRWGPPHDGPKSVPSELQEACFADYISSPENLKNDDAKFDQQNKPPGAHWEHFFGHRGGDPTGGHTTHVKHEELTHLYSILCFMLYSVLSSRSSNTGAGELET